MIRKSTFEDAVIPEDVSLTDFVLAEAAGRGDKAALIDGPSGRTITYAQLVTMVDRTAAGLAARGFKKGDVFAIYSPNVPEFAVAFHGVSRAGGTNTTINPLYTADELTHQLKDSKARFLLTVPMFLPNALEAAKNSQIEEVFVFGEGEGATPFSDLLDNDHPVPEISYTPTEDLVALPYSSGTTGLPKGVMLTHYNMVANILQIHGIEAITDKSVLIAVLPFFHIYGMEVILNISLWYGATIVTIPRFDPELFLTVLQDYGVTRAHLVPPIVLFLAKHPLVDKFDLSKLKFILSGAAPLSEELAREANERLGTKIKQGYGLTETSPVTHVIPDDNIRYGAAGLSLRNTETRIVDFDTGKDISDDSRGEIWIRGPQVMKGYLNNPEATAFTIDDEGFLHTGDIGYMDEDGFLFVVDRVKELIKYKGYQVAPAELEGLLLTHEAIADAAVIPSPDDEAGEIPKAFIVLKAGKEATPEEIMEWVAGKVSPQKKIRLLEITDTIPKSASGKILRRILRQQERERLGKG